MSRNLKQSIAKRVKSKLHYLLSRTYLLYRNANREDYLRMQRKHYALSAKSSIVESGNLIYDEVVGSWRDHDEWPDYQTYLFHDIELNEKLIAVDFGCGPGRNIRRWTHCFKRIDGIDISNRNLENAQLFLQGEVEKSKWPNLFCSNGDDCGDAPDESYDLVFSTITLQHICSYDIRYSILKDMYRILKPGGKISIQMGFGSPSPLTVGYFDNFFEASGTNRTCDTEISDPAQPMNDLLSIGYVDFTYFIERVGPGDIHPNWIYMQATKPINGGVIN